MPCFLCNSPESPLVCPHCASSSSSVEACSNDHLKVHYSPKSIKKGKETESCSSFKIGTKPHIGNVMLASKDIRAGDVVFIERPAVWGPDSKSRPVCLNCLENKSSNQLEAERYFCSKCGFPVCNEECENGMYHVQECDALVESKGSSIQFPMNKNCFEYSAIFPLRILKLKSKEPEVWSRVNLLMDHVDDLEKDMKSLYEKTVDFILDSCKLTKYTRSDILRALGIFRTNGVNQGFSQGFGLYPTFSFISHSCSPNARFQIFENHSLVLRAIQNIPKGEEITISYLPIYQATFRRRIKIKNNWLFDCYCERCKDPSEFGSNLSAVSCKECITGILLPKISTDMKSEWKCSECKYEVSFSSLSNVMLVFEQNMELFLDHDPLEIQFKIDSWTQTLNPNNYLIFLLNRRLLDVLCTNDNFETREDLEKVLLLARDILKIVDLIEPGLSTTRGRILKQIHKPSLKLAKNDLKDGKINSQEFLLITKDIIKNMKTAVRCLEEFNLEESNEIYDRKLVKQSQM